MNQSDTPTKVPLDGAVRPTHWKDERGFVLNAATRGALGFDWIQAYNVPCKVGAFGRIVPLYKCGHCAGKGRDPEAEHDPCPKCGKSGGLPGPNVAVERAAEGRPLEPLVRPLRTKG